MYLEKKINISSDLKNELLESLKINQPKIGYHSGDLSLAMEIFFKKYGSVRMIYENINHKKLICSDKSYVYLNENEKHQINTKISLKEITDQLVEDGDIIIEFVPSTNINGEILFFDEDKTKMVKARMYNIK